MMRALFTVAATVLALAAAAPAAAAKHDVANIFFSPCGEPFRGHDKGPYAVALWFAQADANKDGVLTREEFRADAVRFFASLDLNKDGKLDSAEIKHYEAAVFAPRCWPAPSTPPTFAARRMGPTSSRRTTPGWAMSAARSMPARTARAPASSAFSTSRSR